MAYSKGDARGDILSGFGQGIPLDQDELVDENTILVQRTLRSGQSIHYNGNVVVLGDVNPGAEVAATGNVIVMGALRGVVHAGAGGNENAVVMAFRLQPTQLRIANHITRPPDNDAVDADHPEVARIVNGVVTIEALPAGGERPGRTT
ncbi:MAG: septum site-determining protein MinC [Peptococcaceae bacterium]|nr:septum site-determining protein MinC [Peptococcaceae bacterium]